MRGLVIKGTLFLILCGILLPGQIFAAACTGGVAEPPFLSYGQVDPNLLLMIDNSASMYDMAYLEDAAYCYDDNYTSTDTYAGYFEQDTYYQYNTSNEKFDETEDSTSAYDLCDEAAKDNDIDSYYSHYNDACISVDSGTGSFMLFAARGNFLNWASSSKFDIEKEVLTGGKYDDNNTLIMENRGCANRRFLKEIELQDGYYLNLAVRPPDESEMTSGSDNTTRIEIFPVTTTGFDAEPCQDAVEGLQDENVSQGTIKGDIDSCLDYSDSETNDPVSDRLASFNHSLQNCWYSAQHGEWPSGAGSVESIMNDCEKIYKAGGLPPTITPDNPSYVCYGIYDANTTHTEREGYVGRCWEPAIAPEGCDPVSCTDPDGDGDPDNDEDILPQSEDSPYHEPFCGDDGFVYYCDGNFNENQGTCTGNPGAFRMKVIEEEEGDCDGDFTEAQWTDDNETGDPENCVEQGLMDYCAMLEVPKVVDPSDLASQSGEFWNLPAVLIDSGVLAQIGEPIAVMQGRIARDSPPSGLLQEVSNDIRLGAMTFNDYGAASECEDNYAIPCTSGGKDGGRIIAEIADSNATIDDSNTIHIDHLIDSINDIKALSWTPLAEAMYNAIGYYGQNTGRRINDTDFSATDDPVKYWCQNNNILILTEGASTADLHQDLQDFVSIDGQNDGGDDDNASCGSLSGSTFLDDLSYFAQESNASELYTNPTLEEMDKRNIKTYATTTGSLRITGDDECSPDILMENTAVNGGTPLFRSEDPEDLEENLRRVLSQITTKATSGSAASVISSSRSGEGALYQAIFWPSKEPESTSSDLGSISWVGDVHGLFVNEKGEIYEDTDGDRALTDNDSRVVLYFDEAAQATRACYDYHGEGNCTDARPLHEINYLWSAAEWLGKVANDNFGEFSDEIYYNRDPFISDYRQRYIFTWNDLDNDGIVDQTDEVIPFVDRNSGGPKDWGNSTHTVSGFRGDVIHDFGVSNSTRVNEIVRWVRGSDNNTMRSRRTVKYFPGEDPHEREITWRLGDVVHSTPSAVSRPAEGFHFLYKDSTYAEFVRKYRDRRHVIYFGGNDGMLHAVNGGFYNGRHTKFCLTPDRTADGDCANEAGAMELGAEMWAYVPYNLIPHLKCLTEEDYDHKYFVDMKPRVFDARIFEDDETHPNGWGTLLVGGMGFGGSMVEATELNDDIDIREFRSAYFFLDITDPETPPRLLGETTFTIDSDELNLGYTVAAPAIISMRTDSGNQKWYLVMGSGPTEINGESNQKARLAVLPLDSLTDTSTDEDHPAGSSPKKTLRIPDQQPGTNGTQAGTFPLPAEQSFIPSLTSVDFELEREYKTDAVYFGTVEGNSTSGWEGGLYRLVSRNIIDGAEQTTTPADWFGLSPTQEINNTDYLSPLIDPGQPITAPVAIGTDDTNYWIYFGTGRFYNGADKSDSDQQAFYGIKEPMVDGNFTWETVEKGYTSTTPGDRGLTKVDQIEVIENTGDLQCANGTDACLPEADGNKVTTFDGLRNYIAYGDYSDGWYRNFQADRERNLGQATLLGGLLTFTTYQPYDEMCRARGISSLYGVHYQTGTAWYENIFQEDLSDDTVREKIELGMGLSLTPNLHVSESKEGPTAMVQTSTGEIKEVTQETQPIKNFKSGRASWKEVGDD
ncbi:MAG: pilus assembly protein [Desulfurivibrionaceae bacterium]